MRMNNKGKNNPNYKHGRYCTPHYCCDCGKEIDKYGRSKRCGKCQLSQFPTFKGKKHTEKSKKLIGLKSKAKFTKEYIIKHYRNKFKNKKHKAINGYILIKNYTHPNRNSHNDILEHILVMAKKLNRPLRKGEIVHHINFVRNDNKISNLYLYANTSKHIQANKSLFNLVKNLIDNKIIKFDKKKGIYKMRRSKNVQVGGRK